MPPVAKETERLDRQIGERIRKARKARRMTQADLGGAIGVTFQQVQKYEAGVNRVSSSSLVLIAQALHMEPSELMAPQDPSLQMDDCMSELLRSFRSIRSPRLRQAVVSLARRLAQLDSAA